MALNNLGDRIRAATTPAEVASIINNWDGKLDDVLRTVAAECAVWDESLLALVLATGGGVPHLLANPNRPPQAVRRIIDWCVNRLVTESEKKYARQSQWRLNALREHGLLSWDDPAVEKLWTILRPRAKAQLTTRQAAAALVLVGFPEMPAERLDMIARRSNSYDLTMATLTHPNCDAETLRAWVLERANSLNHDDIGHLLSSDRARMDPIVRPRLIEAAIRIGVNRLLKPLIVDANPADFDVLWNRQWEINRDAAGLALAAAPDRVGVLVPQPHLEALLEAERREIRLAAITALGTRRAAEPERRGRSR